MSRRTSSESYRIIQESGVLSKRRWQAYQLLFDHGPMTGNELSHLARVPGLWKRCSELHQMGLVVQVCERPCQITGMKAIVWDVTTNLPTDIIKPERHRCETCDGKGWLKQSHHFNHGNQGTFALQP